MSVSIPYIIQDNNITLVIDNDSHVISKESHPNYDKILNAIKTSDWDAVRKQVDLEKTYLQYADGMITIENGEFMFDGRPLNNTLTKRFIQMYEDGFPIDPLKEFLNNLMQNPSYRAVTELYAFLECGTLPITPDGHFLAYKRVTLDHENKRLVDGYTKSICNNVGEIVEMKRNEVCDNPNDACAPGLHFASMNYIKGWSSGDPIIIIKINPRDVVSIPISHSTEKGRCCKYEVVSLYGNEAVEYFTTPVTEEDDLPKNELTLK